MKYALSKKVHRFTILNVGNFFLCPRIRFIPKTFVRYSIVRSAKKLLRVSYAIEIAIIGLSKINCHCSIRQVIRRTQISILENMTRQTVDVPFKLFEFSDDNSSFATFRKTHTWKFPNPSVFWQYN